jgi:chemotaxis protein methyltransferase WspC
VDNIRQLLRELIGLDAETIGRKNLDRMIQARMASLGYEDDQAYWRQLVADEASRVELIEEVVIGETWFFRDSENFAAILEMAQPGASLRILSLPCASGEEPYSLAMFLQSQGFTNFEIDGLDVSRRALEKARRAVYGPNSFRGQAAAWNKHLFNPVQEGLELHESVRSRVRFAQANVARPKFLEELGATPYDVVSFRNLSIYLDGLTRQLALTHIHQYLRSDGLLLVSASEADHVPPHLFERTGRVGVFRATTPRLKQVHKLPVPRKSYLPPKKLVVPPAPGEPEILPVPDFQGLLLQAKTLGDRGELVQAQRTCQDLLAIQGPHAEVFYLLAALAGAQGNLDAQERQLRKVVYLQPDHSEALLQLAALMENAGKPAEASRLRSRARRVFCE